MDIGNKINLLRKNHNLTGNQLAEITGISQSVISRYERNIIEPPISTLKIICDALNISLSDFFIDKEEICPDLQQIISKAKTLSPIQLEAIKTVVDAFNLGN